MTVYAGGLRARLIKDSLYTMINEALADLDWFDPGRQHSPISFISEPVESEDDIPINTLALADEDMVSLDQEMGSQLAEHQWTFYLDFFADSNALGVHMAQDLKAILEGRLSAIGRDDSFFAVYDYTQATPTVIFQCQIEDVGIDRVRGYSRPWQRFWYVVSWTVIDYYGRDDDQ